jgi:A/G-specific adenine glycosylase
MNWYRKQARDLEWRGTRDPYAIWISEIVLQQTRVDQGTPYILRFLKRFPTVEKLARAREDSVLKQWEGLGYYTRARNLHKASQVIANERNGEFPTTAKEWESLPGVGRYTAGAIASIAYDEQVPVVDGNVKRVLARLVDLDESIDSPAVTERCWEWMAHLVRGKHPGMFNQSVMELGANVCTPKKVSCELCPLSDYCCSFAAGTVNERPVRTPKKKVPHHQIAIAAIRDDGRYLLGKRPSDGFLGGLWEFPGGKIESGESAEQALHREVGEELGIELGTTKFLASVDHAYSHFKVTLHVYLCDGVSGTPENKAHTELRWVTKKSFGKLAFPKANHKFMDSLP